MLDREGRLEAEIAELRADRDASVARERRLRAALEEIERIARTTGYSKAACGSVASAVLAEEPHDG